MVRLAQLQVKCEFTSIRVHPQIKLAGEFHYDPFILQLAQCLVEIADAQIPMLTKATDIDGGIELVRVVDLQGKVEIVAIVGEHPQVAQSQ